MNSLYREALKLTEDMSLAEVDNKVMEIKGQLEATVDNPQLIKRYTERGMLYLRDVMNVCG